MDLTGPDAPPLLERIGPALAERMLASATRGSYADGRLIHARGDDSHRLCVVLSGSVRLGRLRRDGQLVRLATVGPGHHYGHFPTSGVKTRSHDAVAAGETVIAQLSGAALRRLIGEAPELAMALLEITTQRLILATEIYDDARRLPIEVRLAKLLLRAVATGSTPPTVPSGQDILAQTLGVSSVTLGKGLKSLTDLNLVRPAYGRVIVPDPARLAEWVAQQDPE